MEEDEAWAGADSEAALDSGSEPGSRGWREPDIASLGAGVQQAEGIRRIGKDRKEEGKEADDGRTAIFGTGSGAHRRDRMRDRTGRAARQDADRMERIRGARSGGTRPDAVGAGMIQITPQMK